MHEESVPACFGSNLALMKRVIQKESKIQFVKPGTFVLKEFFSNKSTLEKMGQKKAFSNVISGLNDRNISGKDKFLKKATEIYEPT